MDTSTQVFFSGQYSYRKPAVPFGGLCALGMGTVVLSQFHYAPPLTQWTAGTCLMAVIALGMGGGSVLAGVFLLRGWFTHATYSVEISSAGIKIASAHVRSLNLFHPWDQIAWIAGHSDKAGGVTLFYQKRGRFSPDRNLIVDQNPTNEEFHQLMQAIDDGIGEKYPHLDIG